MEYEGTQALFCLILVITSKQYIKPHAIIIHIMSEIHPTAKLQLRATGNYIFLIIHILSFGPAQIPI
jgi:hypothetical protein